MANIFFTTIGENGGTQASATEVTINENIATGTIVARLDLPAGDTSTDLNTTIQVVQDVDGRYELWFGNHNGTTAWYLRVKNGGPTLFDWEDEALGIGGAAHTDITFLMKDATTGATKHQITGAVILNDLDENPVLSIAADVSANATEGSDGNFKEFTFTVTRTNPNGTNVATWTITGANIDANDFQALTGTVTFNGTEATQTIRVMVRSDALPEGNENFTVTLSNPTNGATIGTAAAQGTIQNDDNGAPPMPTVEAGTQFNLNENTAGPTSVANVDSADDNFGGSHVEYAFANGGNPGNLFAINATTGEVTFTGAGQDFEINNFLTDLGGGNKGFRLKIVATEAGGTATVQTSQELVLDIKLNDVNEAPTAVTFGAASQLVLGEASAQTGAAVVTATFADPDGAASGNRNNRYKFANGTQVDGHFTIDATTGAITTNAALTTAEDDGKVLGVVAFDLGQPALATAAFNFTVNLLQRPSNIQFQTIGGAAVNLAENKLAGDVVGTLVATDDGPPGELVWSMADNNEFVIDAGTGEIKVKNGVVLNFEGTKVFTVAVTVTDEDGGTGSLSATRNITINLSDVNEAPTGSNYMAHVLSETAAVGTTVADAPTINDPDSAAMNGTFVFKLVNADGSDYQGNEFAINVNTGEITVGTGGLRDVTAQTFVPIHVKISDKGGGAGSLSFQQQINVTINPVVAANIAPPTPNVVAGTQVDLNENQSGATTAIAVATVVSDDDDIGGSHVVYAFAAGGNPGSLFAIDPATGVVTFTGAGQNFEINNNLTTLPNGDKVFHLKIVATEAGGTATVLTSQELGLDIKLIDVNEAPTGVTFTGLVPVQAGVTKQGDIVGRAIATDPDGATPPAFRDNEFKFSNGTQVQGAYKIDKDTGVITANVDITVVADDEDLAVVAYDAAHPNDAAWTSPAVVQHIAVAAPPNPTWTIAAVGDVDKPEGTTATGFTDYTFRITRNDAGGDATIKWRLDLPGVASVHDASADDFDNTAPTNDANAVTVNFANGDTFKDITVKVKADNLIELDEAFKVRLLGASNGQVSAANGTANGTIETDDAPTGPPILSVETTTASVVEGNSGPKEYVFTVNRTPGASGINFVSAVNWSVAGAGIDPNDFEALSGTVVFGNNQTSALITLKVKGDAAPEANETFTVTLNQPANAVLDPQKTSASGVILNDDNSAPTDVALSPMTISELAANGTVVGKLSATDADVADTFTYSLVGTDERFEVVGNQLKVKNGFKLDFEQAASHQVTVRTTDKAGATLDKIFSIGVLDVASEVTAGSTDNDVFKGGALTDVFFGNLGNDTLYGGAGNDQLKGDAGNDQLFGGLGKDVMTGGAGNDAFVFDAKVDKKNWKVNLDKVMDYNVKQDSIFLDNAVFTKLGKKGAIATPFKMNKGYFAIGTAKDKNDYVVYDDKKKILYYDADGSGKGAAYQIAAFDKKLKIKMAATEFFVV